MEKWNQLAGRTLASDDPDLREGAFSVLAARAFKHGSVDEQLERIEGLGLQGEELVPFAVRALHEAPNKNSPPLVEWGYARLPERLVREEVGRLVDRWSRVYRPGVEDWVEGLPEGEAKKVGLERLSR